MIQSQENNYGFARISLELLNVNHNQTVIFFVKTVNRLVSLFVLKIEMFSTQRLRLEKHLNRPKTFRRKSLAFTIHYSGIYCYPTTNLNFEKKLCCGKEIFWKCVDHIRLIFFSWVIFHWAQSTEISNRSPSTQYKHYLSIVNSYHNTFIIWKG